MVAHLFKHVGPAASLAKFNSFKSAASFWKNVEELGDTKLAPPVALDKRVTRPGHTCPIFIHGDGVEYATRDSLMTWSWGSLLNTRSNPTTRYRQSSRSPATRRVYTSMFRAPQWHGATQRHFPPRPRKSAWHCDITNVISPHVLPTHYKQSYHTIPPIIPLTSDTPRLHQHIPRSPVARNHAKLRHHERNFATRSAHTLQAIISHDTANRPAHQRYATFTPACFALPGGTAPRKRSSHQGRANPHGTATSRT